MNKFWQSRLQETVGKTVTGFSESANRLKQGWAEGSPAIPPSPTGSTTSAAGGEKLDKPQQQFLRLPIESARKLRWYDREDLRTLVEANLKDKQVLNETIAGLRQALQEAGLPEPSAAGEELATKIEDAERLAYQDEGVNAVLLAGSLAELDALRAQLAEVASQAAQANGVMHNPHDYPLVQLHIHVSDHPPLPIAPSTPHVSALRSNVALPDSPILSHPSTSGELGEARQQLGQTADRPMENGMVGTSQVEEFARQLDEERKGSAAVLAKLTRVERERREHVDELAELGGRLDAAKQQVTALQQELALAKREHADAAATSEHRMQELRAKVAASQNSHADMLRRAQDICSEAEERASTSERRAEKGEAHATRAEVEAKDARAEVKRLTTELKAKQKEAEQASGKAKAAEASLHEALLKRSTESEKGDALSSTLAAVRKAAEEQEKELRKTLRDTEERFQARINSVQAESAEYKRAATAALAQLESLDERAAAAEAAMETASADLHALEGAATERDAIEAQCTALKERLDETRAQAAQLANYKQIAAKLEEEKARVEAEVLATARIATGLESRLRSAQASQEAASAREAAALQQAADAERRVEREVARRLESAAADEASWPHAARDELARLNQRLEASKTMANSLQAELESEVAAHEREAISRASLQMRLTAAEERAARLEREAHQASIRLERQVSQARAEAEEWRREASESGGDRRGTNERWGHMRRSSASSLGPHTPTRGGGSLLGDVGGFEEADRAWVRPASRHGSTSFAGGPDREQMGGVDIVYLKNVVLKFLDAQANGRTDQSAALLPAVAALLRASPQEFKALKLAVSDGRLGSWWPGAR